MRIAASPATQEASKRQSRRRFLATLGHFAALGAVSLMTACQNPPETIVVTPPPADSAPTAAAPASIPTYAPPAALATLPVAPPATSAPAAGQVASSGAIPAAAPTVFAKPVVQLGSLQASAGRPMYQMNPQHTGRSPHTGPERFVVKRSFDTAAVSRSLSDPGDPRFEIQSSAAIGPDGTIYIGNFPGELFALRDADAQDGLSVVWRFHPPGASSFHATPALGPDGTVYLGFSTGGASPDARGAFYALRGPEAGDTAQVLWSVDLGPGRQTSSPTLGPDGTIYVVSGAGKLFAIAPDSTVKWTVKLGPALKTSPALAPDGTVYVASMDGKLYEVSPPTDRNQTEASVRWAFEFGKHPGETPPVTAAAPPPGADGVGSGASPMVAPDGMIYIGANNSNLYAITPEGALRWLFEAEREVAGIWSTPALSQDNLTLYFTANKGGVYALDRESGTLRRQFNVYGSVYSSPTLDSQGTLYTGSTVGHVFALRSDSGQVIWELDAKLPIWTAPALRPDGTLVVADTGGRVMVLGSG